jgi:AcrR family transcriptional regulator
MVKPSGSRQRLLAAAAKAFAAGGYDGVSVDRIARAARLNKAMIYYHFKSKAGLYRAIVRDVFEHVLEEARSAATSGRTPEDKIRRFVEGFGRAASERPHFPAIWLREFSGGAQHLDLPTLKVAAAVVAVLSGIIEEGQREGRFREADPVLVQIGAIAPILLFLVSADARARLARASVPGVASLTLEQVIDHVAESTLGRLRRIDAGPAGE